MSIDWNAVRLDLGMTERTAEEIIHELAHAYDCTGERAFWYVGNQTEVNGKIKAQYGADNNEDANRSEIRVSAITQLVLGNLGILTKKEQEDILDDLLANLRYDWFQHHSMDETERLFRDSLEEESIIGQAQILTKFLQETFSLTQSMQA